MEIDRLKEELAEAGIDITSRQVKAKLKAANRQAEKEAEERFKPTASKAKVADRITLMLSWLAVAFVGIFLLTGNLVNIILFPVAEFNAVKRGLQTFSESQVLSNLNAVTIVTGYVTLLFIRNMIRSNLPGKAPLVTLKDKLKRLTFYLGFGQQPKQYSIIEDIFLASNASIFLLQGTIVLLGFLGRADRLIASDIPYYELIGFILTESTASEFIGYIGTLILTFALLKVTDLIVLFIYYIFVDFVGILELGKNDRGKVNRFLTERSRELQVQTLKDLLIQVKSQQDLTK